jgi:hypothetical protein
MKKFIYSFAFLLSFVFIGCSDYNIYLDNYIIDLNYVNHTVLTPQTGNSFSTLPADDITFSLTSSGLKEFNHFFVTGNNIEVQSVNKAKVSDNEFNVIYTLRSLNGNTGPVVGTPNVNVRHQVRHDFSSNKLRRANNFVIINVSYIFPSSTGSTYNVRALAPKRHQINF